MLKLRDLYTQLKTAPITSSDVTLGQAIIQYEVGRYVDTRNLTVVSGYIVTCVQRLIVPNAAAYTPGPTALQQYSLYPALILANIAVNDPNHQATLIGYFPRTLNTSVTTSQNTAAGNGVTVSQQYTAGSSIAQTNTFGTSASIGFFGDAPTGDVSASSSSSIESEESSALTHGVAVDTSQQLSNSSAMSIKDWGSYVQLDPKDPNLTWVWGQEYPWNVIQFNALTKGATGVILPPFVQQRLVDATDPTLPVLLPPSELSLFGVDVVSKAVWLIVPQAAVAGSDPITFSHTLCIGRGTHSLDGTTVTASLDFVKCDLIQSDPIDLPLYALDPLSRSAPAIIGFVPDRFDVPPTQAGSPFAITAESNDLLVRGAGFTSIMATDFSAGTVQMTLYFKVIDSDRDINLSLKNWIQGTVPCQLALEVNGQDLTRYVDAPETGGGPENITVVALRYKNFNSVNYCDYLVMGMNQVTITITPVASAATTGYQLLAIAVG